MKHKIRTLICFYPMSTINLYFVAYVIYNFSEIMRKTEDRLLLSTAFSLLSGNWGSVFKQQCLTLQMVQFSAQHNWNKVLHKYELLQLWGLWLRISKVFSFWVAIRVLTQMEVAFADTRGEVQCSPPPQHKPCSFQSLPMFRTHFQQVGGKNFAPHRLVRLPHVILKLNFWE